MLIKTLNGWWVTCDGCGFDGLVSSGFVSDECDGYYFVCQCCGLEHILYKESV